MLSSYLVQSSTGLSLGFTRSFCLPKFSWNYIPCSASFFSVLWSEQIVWCVHFETSSLLLLESLATATRTSTKYCFLFLLSNQQDLLCAHSCVLMRKNRVCGDKTFAHTHGSSAGLELFSSLIFPSFYIAEIARVSMTTFIFFQVIIPSQELFCDAQFMESEAHRCEQRIHAHLLALFIRMLEESMGA